MTTPYPAPPRERFIPFRRADLVEACAKDPALDASEREGFLKLAQLVTHAFHFEFHQRLERLKNNYAPFDPDADTRTLRPVDREEKQKRQVRFVADLRALLRAANFDPIEHGDLESALRQESLFRVRLSVNFEDFEQVLFFRRGESLRRETVREFFKLRRREVDFVHFERVVVYVQFKDADHFARTMPDAELPFRPGATMIKLFQDVPKGDLEMLFPNTVVQMKLVDKLLIGIPAFIGGLIVVSTKLLGTLLLISSLFAFWLGLRRESVEIDGKALVALAVGLGSLGAFVFRQVNTFKNRKIRFMKTLADNLYYKNLDNNAGVFHRLLDAAEEEETKEAILGYFFLWQQGPATADDLDRTVERFVKERLDADIGFEVADAVQKLEQLGLLERDEADRLRVPPPAAACAQLDRLWDGHFEPGG